MTPVSHLSGIMARYDALILDLWGVIHDGTALYPGVLHALEMLRADGKKIVLLSNSSRRADSIVAMLSRLGVAEGLYDHVLSSGEYGHQWLAAGHAPWGSRFYFIGPADNVETLAGLGLTRSESVSDADFIAITGFANENQPVEYFMPVLKEAAARGVPMLCLNPDFEVVRITGERFICAGAMAAEYERLGGKVTYFGKPYPEVYARCMQWLAPIAKSRVLAVGDGVVTDIAGAARAGIDSLLISGGIAKHHTEARLATLCRENNALPAYVMPALAW